MPYEPAGRDYTAERVNQAFNYPPQYLQVAFGLNRFELFEGINSFVRQTVEGVLSYIPLLNWRNDGYINQTLRLTRNRNFHHEAM